MPFFHDRLDQKNPTFCECIFKSSIFSLSSMTRHIRFCQFGQRHFQRPNTATCCLSFWSAAKHRGPPWAAGRYGSTDMTPLCGHMVRDVTAAERSRHTDTVTSRSGRWRYYLWRHRLGLWCDVMSVCGVIHGSLILLEVTLVSSVTTSTRVMPLFT